MKNKKPFFCIAGFYFLHANSGKVWTGTRWRRSKFHRLPHAGRFYTFQGAKEVRDLLQQTAVSPIRVRYYASRKVPRKS